VLAVSRGGLYLGLKSVEGLNDALHHLDGSLACEVDERASKIIVTRFLHASCMKILLQLIESIRQEWSYFGLSTRARPVRHLLSVCRNHEASMEREAYKLGRQKGSLMAGGKQFDSGKFKELILLLAARSANDPLMSRVKLNKLLYLVDFEAFRLLGQSITGARYIRGEHGPMAAQLPLAEEELGRRGLLRWRTEQAGPYEQKIPMADEGIADESLFTQPELDVIASALAQLAPHGGKGAREWSHEESAGWRLTKPDKEIPYETSVIASEPAPEQTLARLREHVLSGNWQ
jgi:hypothetical protein